MKKLLFLLVLSVTGIYAQTEDITQITIGAGTDITPQPISISSEFTHSQTLYYPDQLGFIGEITEIRFQTIFYYDALANSTQWIVKLGLSDKYQFTNTDDFIDSSTFTDVFSGTVEKQGYDVIVTFEEPFYYDGSQNLVLDIEEVEPGAGPASEAFKGVKDFDNPPKRSLMAYTNFGETEKIAENSYAQTEFRGDLTRCAQVAAPTITDITISSVEVQLQPNANIPEYLYNVHKTSEPTPDTYEITENLNISVTDLQPATDYIFNVKADCDLPGSAYFPFGFTTKILPLTLGDSITFDEENYPGTYYLFAGRYAKAEVSDMAGTSGTNGILFRSAETAQNWNNNNIWNNNPNFLGSSKFILDVPADVDMPVFKFDLKQDIESYFRIKINNFVYDFEFAGPLNSEEDFEHIIIDLSSFKGEMVELELQHISNYSGVFPNYIRTASIDNVFFKEADCPVAEDLSVSADSTTSLNIQGTADSSSNYEVLVVQHGENSTETETLYFTGLPFLIEDLEIATAYDLYVRKSCESHSGPWKKLMESTHPEIIQVPHQENFQSFNDQFSPLYQEASRIEMASFPQSIILAQKKSPTEWIGGIETTETQAWNENTDFKSALRFRVDATNLSTLSMELFFRLKYFYNSQTSWFRVMINGEQFSDSFNGIATNPNYQTLSLDLSDFTGQVVEVVLEHVGRSDEYTTQGSMDALQIQYVNFFGELGCLRPTELSVANIDETTADISWIPEDGETNWLVKYGLPDFDPEVSGEIIEVSENPNTTLTDLEPETTYDVYVKALCDTDTESSWSDVLTFSTLTPVCAIPEDLVVENITYETAQIMWTPIEDVVGWGILYDEAGFDFIEEGILITTSEPAIILENLTPETDYEVYVRTICSESNHSDWSPVLAFTTASLGISDYKNSQIKIYPNPTGDYVYITSNQPVKEFKIYDLQGRILKSETFTSDTKINLSAFDSGFYLLKLKLEDGAEIMEKLMKR